MTTITPPGLPMTGLTKSDSKSLGGVGGLFKVAGAKGVTMEKINATAKEFESQFVSQMLEAMFATRDPSESLGGSDAEETYQSMLVQEYGKVIERTGGIGIADQITRSMLALQEVEKKHVKTPTA